MRRRAKRLLLISLLLCSITAAFSLTASASEAEEGILESALESLTQILPKGSPVPSDPESFAEGVGISAVFEALINAIKGERSEALGFFLYIFGVAILMALANLLSASLPHGTVVQRAVLAVLAVSVYERLSTLLLGTKGALEEISAFFTGALPIMTALTLSGGGESTAAFSSVGMSITLKLIEIIASSLLLPIVSMIFAVTLVGAVGEDGGIGALSIGIKRLFLWLLGIATTLTGAAFSLQTIVTAAQDSTAMRALK